MQKKSIVRFMNQQAQRGLGYVSWPKETQEEKRERHARERTHLNNDQIELIYNLFKEANGEGPRAVHARERLARIYQQSLSALSKKR